MKLTWNVKGNEKMHLPILPFVSGDNRFPNHSGPPTQENTAPDAEPKATTYRHVGDKALKAYVFHPKTAGSRRPAILLFHGGGWQIGEPTWTFWRAKEFAKKGLVAISIEYRLSDRAKTSPIDAIEDTCAAFTWIRAQAGTLGIDPKRVAGYGVSAGGHLIAAAATLTSVRGKKVADRSRPNALLLFCPALNVADNEDFRGLTAGKGDPALYSPVGYISKMMPPTLIIQAEQDALVPTRDAIAFRDAVEKAGAKCTLRIYPGVGHLLTRNLKVQNRDFDPDPTAAADSQQQEDAFLVSLGYIQK
jgi:acetyl esterase/lipase